MVEEGDPLLRYREVAQVTGLGEATLRNYRRKGVLPDPDDLEVADRPRWRRSTIETWMAGRPGPGNRTRGADRRGGRRSASDAGDS